MAKIAIDLRFSAEAFLIEKVDNAHMIKGDFMSSHFTAAEVVYIMAVGTGDTELP